MPDGITDIYDENAMRAMQSAVWMYNRLTGSVYRVIYVRGRPGRNDVYDERTVEELCGAKPTNLLPGWPHPGCLHPISAYGDQDLYSATLNPHASGLMQ